MHTVLSYSKIADTVQIDP